MASKKRTKSEELFEELCRMHNIKFTRLPVVDAEGKKQPDYELEVSGKCIVAEVKQIDQNAEDKRFADEFARNGIATQCRNPDDVAERVRNQLKIGAKQIRSYLRRCTPVPALVVIYDHANNDYTNSYMIQTAMHGFERVRFELNSNAKNYSVVDRGFAPRNNKEIRKGKHEEVSALVTLHEFWHLDSRSRDLGLCFYHNQFSARPFNPQWWQGPNISHLVIEKKSPGRYQNWKPIEVSVDDVSK